MKSLKGRPALSFGTKSIPRFYIPIVRNMQTRLKKMGYSPVVFNKPYAGGYILDWLNVKFPNVFICSLEVNKCLYMNKSMMRSYDKKIEKLQKDLPKMFDICDVTKTC